MRISSIQQINTIFGNYQPKYKQNLYSQNDMFVKSEQVSFGKKKQKSREDLIKEFSNEAKKIYFDEKFDIKKIEKLAQKNLPELSVKNFDELKTPYKLPKEFIGVYTESLSYDDTTQLASVSDKTLYLKKPNQKKFPLIAYYANCVHEYTHALQNADEKISAVNCLNKLLQKSTVSPEAKERTATFVPEFAINVESKLKEPINNSIANLIVDKYLQNKQPTINDVYEANGIKDIKKHALKTIDEMSDKYIEKYGEMDKNILKEYTLMHLKRENEAYQVESDTYRKIFPNYFKNPIYWNIPVKIQLYRILANIK